MVFSLSSGFQVVRRPVNMLLTSWIAHVLVPAISVQHVDCMFHRKTREFESEADPPEKRLRHNLAELYLDNQVSADRAISLFTDAHVAGARYVGDLTSKRPYSRLNRKTKQPRYPNAQRDLLRRLMKRSHWPPVYHAKVRVFDTKEQKETTQTLAMILPHEIIWALAQHNRTEDLLDDHGMSATCKSHLATMCSKFQVSSALAAGIWIDGVPCNWDRSQSLECITLNLPGLRDGTGRLRIPIAVINKRFLLKEKTFDDILSVVAWSFQWLSQGKFPPRRHDGSPFGREPWRKAKAGSDIGLRAFLCELRGDWLMLKEVMRIPAWNRKAGCCFKCNVTPNGIRSFSSDAEWRKPENRLDHWSFLKRLLEEGSCISTLYGCPGFVTECIAIDWLHCCDIGVCCDFLGNFLWMLLPFQTGSNIQDRISALFLKMKEYYANRKCEDRLDNLTETMLRKKPTSSPKLRAKAAEARALVDFAAEQAASTLDATCVVQATAIQAALELQACYKCLSREHYEPKALETHCIRFCSLYGALEANAASEGDSTWKVKPKFHVFQELCSLPNNPSSHWVCRDEDFGGYLAGTSRRRGGAKTVLRIGKIVLNKFRAKHKLCLR